MSVNAPLTQERLPIERRARVRTGQNGALSEPRPISHFHDVHAWVLLGDPGAGKSDVFEARRLAENGVCVSARKFIELEDQTLNANSLVLIDGLDEISAGTAYGYTALGQIRGKLQRLGTPRFRIACREADWRGSSDSQALIDLVGAENFLELHLEPLSREETRALVEHWQGSDAEQAATFVREAEHRDLDGLLDNPQTLRMLVDATASGWPESKTQTYQMACAKLVQEHNEAWLAQTRETAQADDALLQAAGYLCALMLLSGSAAMALQRAGHTQHDLLALPDLPAIASAPGLELCRTVLHRRLFRCTGKNEFMPVHRTVAEYLAAHCLVQRINAGLPVRRVLALMLGEDGGVVPELRGLHAWLAAAASGDLRAELVEHDPLGIVLYGDVRDFTRSEKLRVLGALGREAKRYTFFRSQDWTSQPFGTLATPDMEEDFRVLLTSPDRSPPHLALVDCILDALAHGHGMHGLKPELERVIRDASYWTGSRTEALRILTKQEKLEGRWSVSKQLLQDIHARKVEDTEDQLLGTLLSMLYPAQIPATEIWTYFRKPKSDSFLGAYWEFWHYLAKKYAPAHDIPVLLDALLASGFQLGNQHDTLRSAEVVGELLVKGVRQFGTELELARLYRWLSLGLGPHHHCPLDPEHKNALRQWLEEHPNYYKALFEHGLRQQAGKENPWGGIWQVLQHLYQAAEPRDADQWYLSLANKTPQDEWRRHLLYKAFHFTEGKNGTNPALEMLETWRVAHSNDAPWVDEFLHCNYPPSAQDQEHINFEIGHKRKLQDEERQKIEFFRKTLPSFNSETAHLGALVEVADAYLNFSHDGNEKTPQERLLALLNHNAEWMELALKGLRQCLFREDLPSAQTIIDLLAQGERYTIATPCLAAMVLRYTESPATALELPQAILETVVAFRLTNDYDNPPDWFKQLLVARTDIVANVLRPFVSARISAKKEHVSGLFPLAHNAEYGSLARLIVPDLLERFPAKAHKKQLQSLRLLVIATLTQLDKKTALEIIAAKLAGKPMDVAQHVYWLGTGLLLAPDLFLESARQYVGLTQARVSHLIALLHERRCENKAQRITPPIVTIEFLIKLLGPRCNPRQWRGGAGRVTPAMELGEYVEGLIATLAGIPDDKSTQVLAALLKEQKLAQWGEVLRRAIFDQQITRRKARFQPATVPQICNTLANLKPANAADLWALTLDHLTQLAREIRDGNTDDYDQYWSGETPKSEQLCRNALLSDLKRHLAPLGISAEAESQFADETRADIKVTAVPYHLPIEIKGEWHKDVWKAIREQLVIKYGRESASDGYGIFLVFWFYGKFNSTPTDGGSKPKTPQELQRRLAATVPEALKHKIAVLVVDCSKPQAAQSTKKISLQPPPIGRE